MLTERFRPESDIDVVVAFEAGYTPRWFLSGWHGDRALGEARQEVDLRTPRELSKHFRDKVVAGAAVQYERP